MQMPAIPTSTPIFSAMPDSDCRHCPTSADYRKSRWRTSTPEVCGHLMNSGNQPTSGSVTVRSGMVTNVGGRSSFRSVVISISGFGGRHLDNVRSDTMKSSIVDNSEIALRIAAPSLAVEKLFHIRLRWSPS